MRNIKVLLAFVLIFQGASAFAFPLNGYFQQGIYVDDQSNENILVTDPAEPQITNYLVPQDYHVDANFSSDQFTVASGQAFSHTVNINSAVNNKLICTVKSDLVLGLNSMHVGKPSSSDESRCQTTNNISSSGSGYIFQMQITVLPPKQ